MKIAIKGHPTRGKEVIQILENLGGNNLHIMTGSTPDCAYYINSYDNIDGNPLEYVKEVYRVYTLEEFEKEFPFKVGETVITTLNHVGTIIGIANSKYKVLFKEDSALIAPHRLKPYKEMKEERNITLTLDKAKEWYKKGGELKEIALQAFSEEELTKVDLPKTWEEFCENYPVQVGECWLENCDEIRKKELSNNEARIYKNWIPSQKSAEAHLAMIQLEQLRNCWRQGWKPTTYDTGYVIVHYPNDYIITNFNFIGFLSFPTKEMAEEFLECFRDLIEKAGDLI